MVLLAYATNVNKKQVIQTTMLLIQSVAINWRLSCNTSAHKLDNMA